MPENTIGEGPADSRRAFLNNHAKDLVSIDFFTVPTVTFNVLFVFVILAHDRRRLRDHPGKALTWSA